MLRRPEILRCRLLPCAGFSLVELLVVVAVIGGLAAFLLPALTSAKQRAQATQCLGNSRQLAIALHLYTDEANDWLPPNPDLPSDAAWVQGDMTNPDEATNTFFLTDPSQAKLAPYGIVAGVYKCPADPTAHVRSVSMNQAVGTKPDPPLAPVNGPWLNGVGTHIANSPWKTYGRLADMTAPVPAQLWVFTDEDPNSINDASFAVAMTLPTKWVDWPATQHGYSSSLSFADGHSENHRWHDGRTRLMNGSQVVSARPQPANADILWLQAHTSARSGGGLP